MVEATNLFSGTIEEPRFLLANVESCVSSGEIDKGLLILATIQPNQSCFIAAKSKMADIYLKHKKDVKNYAKCYSEIVQKKPTMESCLLLGDAYMNIQEPEQAVTAYYSALKMKNNNIICSTKIGNALVMMHEYDKAVSFYQSSISANSLALVPLSHDFSNLLLKLGRLEQADQVIVKALGAMEGIHNLN